jgi:hypothetical protein
MSKSYRIRTTPGEDNGYLKVNVDLTQNYDHLEILSLKISQKDEYQSYCAEYGVIAGRVIINNGFGVPNVRVSVFVPVDDADLNDPVKSAIYPYTEPFPDQKNRNGIRYNVLPSNQQKLDHTPVGTFPKKRQVLDDNTTLEIYEKYYKYTTTTNTSGDYILFGVPVGDHFLHYDMDVSDIGFLSVRPFELIDQGYSDNLFKDRFKFKSSNNLDSLPQIFSENTPIRVEPYWCDSLNVGSGLGINRLDISIDSLELIPTAIFMGSIFSDDEKDSLNKNCKPAREMGKLNEVITGPGKIEAIRRTVDGNIEKFTFKDNSIDDNGNWSVLVPMNIRKVVTDEFGNLVPSPDGIKGVSTEGDYRFRVSMDATSNDKRLRERAKYLVPNTNNNFNFREYGINELKTSSDFKINQQLSTITDNTPYANDLTNQYNYLEEFYPFRWKKVYTVKQYIGRMQKIGGKNGDEARGFIGIKDILNGDGVNKFPTNRLDTNFNPLYSIICLILTIFGHVVGFLNGILNIINGLITSICSVKLPVGLSIELRYCFNLPAGFEFCNQKYKDYYCGGNCGSGTNDCGNNCDDAGGTTFYLALNIKWKCLFSALLCKTCKDICGGSPHSCCLRSNGPSYAEYCPYNDPIEYPATSGVPVNPPCCGKCCVKVPLIPLKCADEGKEYRLTLIKTPFGDDSGCNAQFVLPFSCTNCGGIQTPGIKDWVSCVMEPVAVFLRMLKFDFYNDWVGGTLYFPLVKRKYKLKKRKRKFGQIKKDKFCDFDCKERGPILGSFTNNFQGDPTFKQWRIKIPSNFISAPTIVLNDCVAKVRSKRVTDWYGTNENDLQTPNLNLAVKELEFKGKNSNFEGCKIVFNNFSAFQNTFNTFGVQYEIKDREVQGEHGKPEYVETEDAAGNSTWTNIGGHGHHRNICDDTRMMERKEYFKTSLDCVQSSNYVPSEDEAQDGFGDISQPQEEEPGSPPSPSSGCPSYTCAPDCSTNGVAPCIYNETEYNNFSKLINHGLISWADGSIYYTPYIPKGDVKYNNNEYKANLMLPTTIMELGSSTYCDIDDIPFIMDVIPPTTFNVSYEDVKYKLGTLQINGTTGNRTILKFDDKKDISLNLRAYVELSCFKTVCVNTSASVNQSQIGVDIIDKNDIGIEIGNCFLRFEHDEDIRSYFCKRFNGYKSSNLTFHHQRPGSLEFDNVYNTYPEISLSDGFNLFYNLEGQQILSEYNDGDSFIPGDACGYKKTNGSGDYFYGLAPGQTSSFINYPNGNQTINFNQTAQLDGVDEINQISGINIVDDNNNGSNLINGIKFNRTQTPYFLYFGLVPGKTALHRTVSQFFGDLIDAVTLEGLNASNDTVSENINNSPNINNGVDNPFTVYRTCLGETLIQTTQVGGTITAPNNPNVVLPTQGVSNNSSN